MKKKNTITLKPSTRVHELVEFLKSNLEHYSDVTQLDRINVRTLKGNIAGDDRRLRALTETDLSKGIEISIESTIETTLEKIRDLTGIEINYIDNVDDFNSFLDNLSKDTSLSYDEWHDFSDKLREKKLLPELTFIFDDVLSSFATDKHYPFFYADDVLVANQFTSFIYANIDGIYTSINGDDVSLIMTWDKIKIDDDMGDGIYYVDEGDSPEPEHLILYTEDEEFLSLSKDKTLYFMEYLWNDIIKDITNLSRDGIVSWNAVKMKLGIERIQFNSWDEIREFMND